MSYDFLIEMGWKSAAIAGGALLLAAMLRSRSAADRGAVLKDRGGAAARASGHRLVRSRRSRSNSAPAPVAEASPPLSLRRPRPSRSPTGRGHAGAGRRAPGDRRSGTIRACSSSSLRRRGCDDRRPAARRPVDSRGAGPAAPRGRGPAPNGGGVRPRRRRTRADSGCSSPRSDLAAELGPAAARHPARPRHAGAARATRIDPRPRGGACRPARLAVADPVAAGGRPLLVQSAGLEARPRGRPAGRGGGRQRTPPTGSSRRAMPRPCSTGPQADGALPANGIAAASRRARPAGHGDPRPAQPRAAGRAPPGRRSRCSAASPSRRRSRRWSWSPQVPEAPEAPRAPAAPADARRPAARRQRRGA